MVKVIIAGSRNFNDYELVEKMCHFIFYTLSKENKLTGHISEDVPNMEIISGTAKGADTLGEKFAKQVGIKIKQFAPRWDIFGKKAGMIRNRYMADYAIEDDSYGVLIAFWDTKSKGTKGMIEIALDKGLRIFIVNTNTKELIHDYGV